MDVLRFGHVHPALELGVVEEDDAAAASAVSPHAALCDNAHQYMREWTVARTVPRRFPSPRSRRFRRPTQSDVSRREVHAPGGDPASRPSEPKRLSCPAVVNPRWVRSPGTGGGPRVAMVSWRRRSRAVASSSVVSPTASPMAGHPEDAFAPRPSAGREPARRRRRRPLTSRRRREVVRQPTPSSGGRCMPVAARKAA